MNGSGGIEKKKNRKQAQRSKTKNCFSKIVVICKAKPYLLITMVRHLCY